MYRTNRQYGFTLIEVLVVLVIVAIITAVAVLAFGNFGRGRNEKIRVETFARMIRAAQSQSILTPVVLGLKITPKGYFFDRWITDKNGSRWQKVSNSVLSQPNSFYDWFKVRVTGIGHYDLDDKNHGNDPVIVFLPSGYVTSFQVLLDGKVHQFRLHVSNNGDVKVEMKSQSTSGWSDIST